MNATKSKQFRKSIGASALVGNRSKFSTSGVSALRRAKREYTRANKFERAQIVAAL